MSALTNSSHVKAVLYSQIFNLGTNITRNLCQYTNFKHKLSSGLRMCHHQKNVGQHLSHVIDTSYVMLLFSLDTFKWCWWNRTLYWLKICVHNLWSGLKSRQIKLPVALQSSNKNNNYYYFCHQLVVSQVPTMIMWSSNQLPN